MVSFFLKVYGFFEWSLTGWSEHFSADEWWRMLTIPAVIIILFSLVKMTWLKIRGMKEFYDDNYKYDTGGYIKALDDHFRYPKKLKASLLVYLPMLVIFGFAFYFTHCLAEGLPIMFNIGADAATVAAIALFIVGAIVELIVYFKFGGLDTLIDVMPAFRNDYLPPQYVTVPYKIERWTGAYNSEWKVTETQTYNINGEHNQNVFVHNATLVFMAIVTVFGDMAVFLLFSLIDLVWLLIKLPFYPLTKARIESAFEKRLRIYAKDSEKQGNLYPYNKKSVDKSRPYETWMNNYFLTHKLIDSVRNLESGADTFTLVANYHNLECYGVVNLKRKVLEVKEGDSTYYVYETDAARVFIIVNNKLSPTDLLGFEMVTVPFFANKDWQNRFSANANSFETLMARFGGPAAGAKTITQILGQHGFVKRMQYYYFKELKKSGIDRTVSFMHYFKDRLSAEIVSMPLSRIALDDAKKDYGFTTT